MVFDYEFLQAIIVIGSGCLLAHVVFCNVVIMVLDYPHRMKHKIFIKEIADSCPYTSKKMKEISSLTVKHIGECLLNTDNVEQIIDIMDDNGYVLFMDYDHYPTTEPSINIGWKHIRVIAHSRLLKFTISGGEF